jgi:hypothetical protein
MNNPRSPKPSPTQTLKFSWPVWFPYPIAWLRTIILIPIAFPGVRLIFLGFAGSILSITSPDILILSICLLFGILIPTTILSYIYYIFWFFWHESTPKRFIFKIIPNKKSWWEGFYATFVVGLSFTLISLLFAGLSLIYCQLHNDLTSDIYSCVGRMTGRSAKLIVLSVENNNFLDKPWFIIWMFLSLYLYHFEYIIKYKFMPNWLNYSSKHIDKKHNKEIDIIDLELNKIKAEMGLTQAQKVSTQSHETLSSRNFSQKQYRKIIKQISLGLLIPLVAGGIYLFSKLPDFTVIQSAPIASQSELVSTPEKLSTENAPSSSPEIAPSTDNFRLAVNQAMDAAKLTQSAKSPDEWQEVVNQWQKAIDMMKSVPASSNNYALAQTKITEYQKNLNYAQKNAVRK